MKNILFYCSIIIVLVLSCIFYSCKKRAEYNDFDQITIESIACDSIKDMAESLPRIENYKDYKLRQVICLPESKTFSLIYFTKDSLSQMSIDIHDITLYKNSGFLIDTKQSFELAEQGEFKNRKVSKLIGEYASFSTVYPEIKSKDAIYITSFKCILKEKYNLRVFITQNKKPVIFESFFKDYVSKIDLSKLK